MAAKSMNHLHTEKSPYLLQHINNPVDWYPWSESAFERARNENKLIFLSVGYSTCHWCHVMAHECFEDAEVAELLNRDYVSIKVDREERPDIDQVYMEVCQRLTNSGGWPLTIIMTPDALPFYAATYIPKHGRHGRPGLMELLPWVTTSWHDNPEFLRNAAHEITAELQAGRSADEKRKTVNLDLYAEAEATLKKSYDRQHGGFGQSPKFPRPHDLTFLLQQFRRSGDVQCLSMVEQTLQAMRNGGIYDQLGFGFHRYATDEKWLVPHFEKMLYDQAGLIPAYLEAWQITGADIYAATVREILSYLLRDMTAPEGGLFSAEDADSEGVEGKFYLWSKAEIADVLGADAAEFCKTYNVLTAGNYHDEMTGKTTGGNILHRSTPEVAKAEKSVADEAVAASRKLLFEERKKRVRPHLDDKIITAWNGMAISAFANAGRMLGDRGYITGAQRIADFILTMMRNQDGRLFRRYRQGEVAVSAFSEDYAFLARGLLDLYAADFVPQNLAQAIEIAQLLLQFFQDPESGQLYDTPSDGEQLLVRPSSTYDGATPSASSIALEVFARLFLLTGAPIWQTAAEQLLQFVSKEVFRYPAGYTQLLQSANWLLRPTREVVVVGVHGESSTEIMLSAVRNCKMPQTVVIYKAVDDPETIAALTPFTCHMHIVNEFATAYVCQNFTCEQPLNDAEELQVILNSLPG